MNRPNEMICRYCGAYISIYAYGLQDDFFMLHEAGWDVDASGNVKCSRCIREDAELDIHDIGEPEATS